MILDELKTLPCDRRSLRHFGLLVGGIFLLLSAWYFHRGKVAAPYLLIPGIPLFALGLAAPMALRRPYLAWMALGLAMGHVVGSVLLTILYFTAFTLVGWIARMSGRDFMNRTFNKSAKTYWTPRESPGGDPASSERQF